MSNQHSDCATDAITKIDKALKRVHDICQGTERWTMRVPARPDEDTDLILCDALETAKSLLSAVATDEGYSGIAHDLETMRGVLREVYALVGRLGVGAQLADRIDAALTERLSPLASNTTERAQSEPKPPAEEREQCGIELRGRPLQERASTQASHSQAGGRVETPATTLSGGSNPQESIKEAGKWLASYLDVDVENMHPDRWAGLCEVAAEYLHGQFMRPTSATGPSDAMVKLARIQLDRTATPANGLVCDCGPCQLAREVIRLSESRVSTVATGDEAEVAERDGKIFDQVSPELRRQFYINAAQTSRRFERDLDALRDRYRNDMLEAAEEVARLRSERTTGEKK